MNYRRWGGLFALAFALLVAFSGSLLAAEGARPSVNFNHDQTKFPLVGMHSNTACEGCHVRGVFKGTPTSCSDCHNRGAAANTQSKSATHIPTQQECSVCHKAMGWSPATFSHANLTQSCETCHNGVNQVGKPSFHINTSKGCGECHSTSAWLPAGMDHSTLIPPATGRCSDCHGRNATGKPTGHIFTTAQCDTCHKSTSSWASAGMDHSTLVPPATGRCNECHTGPNATNKPAQHIQTSAQCEVCHVTTGWLPTSFDHSKVSAANNCTTCHNGTNAKGTTSKHISVTGMQCDKCHTTTGWLPTSFNHSQVSATGNCANCHNGINAKGKGTTHISTASYPSCDICHTVGAWKPTQFNHQGVISSSNCTTCHDGKNATGRPTAGAKAHIVAPMTANACGSCHTVGTAWAPIPMNHSGATSCASCHLISSAGNVWTPGKAGHISTTGHAQCSDCHTTAGWKPSTFSHQGVTSATDCATGCHGQAGKSAPVAGVPLSSNVHAIAPMTSKNCGICHAIGIAWGPGTKMNHTGVSSCSSCHTYAGNDFTTAKANHIVTGQACSLCHITAAWKPAYSHAGVTAASNCATAGCHGTPGQAVPIAGVPSSTSQTPHTVAPMNSTSCGTCHAIGTSWGPGTKMNHTGVTNCSTCHAFAGNKYTPAKANHITIGSAQCSSCHTTTAWKPATNFNHAAVGVTAATNCTQSNCHSTANAPVPKAGLPTSGLKMHQLTMAANTCGSCHTVGASWTPATMNHTGLTTCGTCHATAGNGFTPAKANHIATGALQCSACHTTTLWKPAYSHVGVTASTNCATAGCHNTPGQAVPVAGVPTAASQTPHTTAPMNSTSCGTCHAIGTAWGPGTKMNHAGVTNCSSCHAYAGNAYTAPKAGHVVTALQCSSCHTSVAWKPAYSHAGVTAASNCATAGCHGTPGQAVPIAGVPSSTSQTPHTVAPMNSTSCGTCHAIGTSWGPGTKMNHTGVTNCSTCHAFAGNKYTPAKANHITIGSAQCSSCHTTTAWKPATNFNHAAVGVTAATNCTQSNCHSTANAPVPKAGLPTSGLKMHQLTMAANTCGSCHTVGASWTPATMNHTGLTTCGTCHATAGNGFTPAKANHIATGALQCSACHTTTLWKPAYSHVGVTASTNCATAGCHNTPGQAVPVAGVPTAASQTPHTAAPMSSTSCGTCHAIGTAWGPGTKMNHAGVTNCSSCHAYAGNAYTAPKAGHVVTALQCSSCHTSVAWKPANYSHTGVTAATDCTTAGCHGTPGQGVPVAGAPTSAALSHAVAPMNSKSCALCHQIGTAWGPGTKMNHAGVTTCKSCHAYAGNNYTPTKVGHITTTQECVTCHVTTAWLPAYSHTGVTAATNCATAGCHSVANQAVPVAGRPTSPSHTVAPMNSTSCGTCHAVGTAWGPGTKMNHAGVTACSSCHSYTSNPDGYTAGSPKSGHVVTTQQCSICHSTSLWKPAYSHAGVTAATNCATAGCHSTAGQGVPVAGTPTGALAHTAAPMTSTSCGTCHTIGTSWGPGTKMNHTGVTNCTACHITAGNTWTTPGKANHISIGTSQCSSCHATTAWKPATNFNHAANGITAATNCAQSGCHNTPNKPPSLAGMPISGANAHTVAPMTNNTCGNCHQIGSIWGPGTKMNHTGVTACSSCHSYSSNPNGWTAGAPKAGHVVSSLQCSTCHSTTLWKPAYSHTGVTSSSNCTTSGCHSTAGQGVPVAGRPTSASLPHTVAPMNSNSCAICHQIGTTWGPGTKMNHVGVTSCSSCHAYTGTAYTAAKPGHIVTTQQCSVCHTSSAWKPAVFSHTGITAASNCATSGCHSVAGQAAPVAGTPTGTLAHTVAPMTSTSCGTCHTIGTSWGPGTKMNHTGVTSCSSCHATTGTSWNAPKVGHIAYANGTQCSACHTTNAWLPAGYNHVGLTAASNCATSGCHNVTGQTSAPMGAPTGSLAHTVAPMTSTSCGTCHAIGTVWGPNTKMNHAGVTNCSACHATTGTNWNAAKSGHISIGSSQCSACHTTTAWTPASTFNHAANGITSASNCATSGCHNVPGQAAPVAGSPTGAMAHTVAPMTSTSCGTCHGVGTFWGPGTKMNHAGVTNCSACHVTAGNVWTTPGKPTHIAIGTAQCSTCHATSAWTPAGYNHSGVTAASNCATSGCHNVSGQATPVAGPPTGAMAHTVAPMTSSSCGTCHSIGTIWGPGTKMNHTGVTNCTSCHVTGGNVWTTPGKANHISIGTNQCSVCHSTTTWTTSSFNHAAVGVTAATNCTQAGCHDTAGRAVPQAGRPLDHTVAPMTNTTCATCHQIGTVWTGTKMNHTGVTSCTSCHSYTSNPNGWTVGSPKATHMVTALQCSSCHTTSGWLPATFNHQGVTSASTCNSSGCHNVPNAAAPKAGVPTTGSKAHTNTPMTSATCATCHTIGTAWTPATMNHSGLTTCKQCHAYTGNGFTQAVATHISTTSECNVCHTTSAWKPTSFAHTTAQIGTKTCKDCHNGVAATGPSVSPHNHAGISPAPYNCSSCHRTTGWAPATFAHSGVTTGCANCHKLGFAATKSATHFVTTQPCEKCHSTTTWTSLRAYAHTTTYYTTHNMLSLTNKADCLRCHIGNNEVISGAPNSPNGNAGYKPQCAWCHAGEYKIDKHKKTSSPTKVFYPLSDHLNCGAACHEYTNNTFSTVKQSFPAGFHPNSKGF